MSLIKILFVKEWKSAVRSRILPSFAFMSVIMIFMLSFIVTRTPLTSALLSSFIISGLSPFSILIPVAFIDVFVSEKRSRTILTLLAAPVPPLDIWVSKSLFLTSLSFIFTTGVSLILSAIVGQIPEVYVLFCIFLVIPLLEFSVSGLLGYLSMGRLKPSTATSIGALLMMAIILSNVFIPQAFSSIVGENILVFYPIFYLVLGLILLLLSVLLVRKLDRESITAVVQVLAALIKKDIKLTTKTPPINFIALFLVGFSVFTAMPLFFKTGTETYLTSTPLPILLFCYYIFIDDLFRKEASMKTMDYNILAGANLQEIWVSKAIAPFLLSYGSMLVFSLLFIILTKGFPSLEGALVGFVALPLLALPFFFLFSMMCLFRLYTITSFLCIVPVIISQFLRIDPLFYALSYIMPVAVFFFLRRVSVERVVKI